MLGTELCGRPGARVDEHLRELPVDLRLVAEHACVPVPHDRRAAKGTQAFDRLDRLRADSDVAETDDSVDAIAVEIGEHLVERGQVAVNVCDQGQPHPPILTQTKEGQTGRSDPFVLRA